MHEGKPILNIQIGGNGASTARLYIFVECALFLQLLFQQNKTNVSFRESARLIARNSSCVMLTITNIEAQMGFYLKEKD